MKEATTNHLILKMVKEHWSPRAFADKEVEKIARNRKPLFEIVFGDTWNKSAEFLQ